MSPTPLVAALLIGSLVALIAAAPTGVLQETKSTVKSTLPKPPSSVVPVARTEEGSSAREAELILRVKEGGTANVVFVGDSITQAWNDPGKAAWDAQLAPLDALNLGNSGDRTEHVLYRLTAAPLTRLKPKHVVLLIGTNNLGHGTSTVEETLLGVTAVAQLLGAQCPDAVIHIIEIFPRGDHMNPMRGEACQINQALRTLVREGNSRYAIHAIGDAFVSRDGTISKDFMPDSLGARRLIVLGFCRNRSMLGAGRASACAFLA